MVESSIHGSLVSSVAMVAPRPQSLSDVTAWSTSRFGLPKLREGQAEVILALLQGRRCLFVAPTGHGKSLCYQALAASPWSRGTVLVFQPLKALMHEQVQRAIDAGLRAEVINSDLDAKAQRRVLDRVEADDVDLLFISPERQGNQLWLEHVGKLVIKGVVIDEAHCISQWGHDFRPWYQRLVRTIMGLGRRTPVLAITATAPGQVIDDVRTQIGPSGEPIEEIRLASYRGNLHLSCVPVQGFAARLGTLLQLTLRENGAPGIAYLLTQDETEIASKFLASRGIRAGHYHAGLDAETRSRILASWYGGTLSVLCATSALGMGIDRPDIRWIVHAGLPDSLLRYVQEIGRAGRDGKPARIAGIHDPAVKGIYDAFLNGSAPAPEDYRSIADALRAGQATRTQIVLDKDVPESTAQRILSDFIEMNACERTGHSPYTYSWTGRVDTDVPAGLEDARATRQRFLHEVFEYANHQDCLASHLSEKMGDGHGTFACGQCDRCRAAPLAAVTDAHVDAARHFLTSYCPPIRAVSKYHVAGVSLSRYGMGLHGEAVAKVKYSGAPLPLPLIDHAMAQLSDPTGPYAGVSLDAIVAIPSSTSTIVDQLASFLAQRLGIPWHQLQKNRLTSPQKALRSKQRKRKNIDGAFDPLAITAHHVLLIDDVIDSGESLRAASSALRPATVYPLVMARAKHQDRK